MIPRPFAITTGVPTAHDEPRISAVAVVPETDDVLEHSRVPRLRTGRRSGATGGELESTSGAACNPRGGAGAASFHAGRAVGRIGAAYSDITFETYFRTPETSDYAALFRPTDSRSIDIRLHTVREIILGCGDEPVLAPQFSRVAMGRNLSIRTRMSAASVARGARRR